MMPGELLKFLFCLSSGAIRGSLVQQDSRSQLGARYRLQLAERIYSRQKTFSTPQAFQSGVSVTGLDIFQPDH
jgi:hypothetical protein